MKKPLSSLQAAAKIAEKVSRKVVRPKLPRAHNPAMPMPRGSSASEMSQGKLQQVSSSQQLSSSHQFHGQSFTPQILSNFQVDEVIGLTLSADRLSIRYLVIFQSKKDKKLKKKFMCNRKDMKLIDERFRKKYRFRYLISYLKRHREE